MNGSDLTNKMSVEYNFKAFLFVSLLVITGMLLLSNNRLNSIEETKISALDDVVASISKRISRAVSPTIWDIYEKSSQRKYTDELASAFLDSELDEEAVVAINVYGNFGHLYMGRIKTDNTIQPLDKNNPRHSNLLSDSKQFKYPISQGSMTIGSVAIFYSEQQWLNNHQTNAFLDIFDLLIITVLQIVVLYFALRMSQAKSIAEQSNRIKSQFLANMSHEIRTPMNAIVGLLELLKSSPLDREQKENIDTIQAASSVLINIINDILDFSKIEADKTNVDISEIDVSRLLNNIFLLFKDLAADKQLGFSVNIISRVPAFILADEIKIQQILNNLITNAIKFTDGGEVTVNISSQISENDQLVLSFVVTDTGVGISEENQKYLFQSFTQAESSTTRRYGGTGLGLAISLRMAELMQGTIDLESGLNIGSVFTYTQPVTRIDSKDLHPMSFKHQLKQPIAVHSNVLPNDTTSTTNNKILIVEDNPVNQVVLKKQIGVLGYKADFAEDGEQGYSAWLRGDYSLVITDCQMPVMDGYQLAVKIRETEKQEKISPVSIIALTANAMSYENDRCLEAGMNDVIYKPYSVNTLEEKIKAHWTYASDPVHGMHL